MKTILCLCIFLLAVGSLYSQEVAVIVNKSVTVSSADAGILSQVYSLNKTEWTSGKPVKASSVRVDAIKKKFYSFINTSEDEVKRVWLKKKLTDGTETPKVFEQESDLLEYVKSTPGAIGFVSADKVTSDVKVLTKIK